MKPTVRRLAEDQARRSPDPEIPKIRMNLLRSPGFHPRIQDRQGPMGPMGPIVDLVVQRVTLVGNQGTPSTRNTVLGPLQRWATLRGITAYCQGLYWLGWKCTSGWKAPSVQ